MPVPTLYLPAPLDPAVEQPLRRFLAGNLIVKQVTSLLRDLQQVVRQQLWFEAMGSVLLVYTREGEHIGYITAE